MTASHIALESLADFLIIPVCISEKYGYHELCFEYVEFQRLPGKCSRPDGGSLVCQSSESSGEHTQFTSKTRGRGSGLEAQTMVRHPVHIRIAVVTSEDDEMSRDLVNRAYHAIQTFAAKRTAPPEISPAGDVMDIWCLVTAESFEDAAKVILEAFEAARKRDELLERVVIRVSRSRR